MLNTKRNASSFLSAIAIILIAAVVAYNVGVTAYVVFGWLQS